MPTADHPQTNSQTERVNRVVLRSFHSESPRTWSLMLPVIEFALNNAVHASTGFTPFYVNSLTHPHVPLTLPLCGSGLDGDSLLTSLPISAHHDAETHERFSRDALSCLTTCT